MLFYNCLDAACDDATREKSGILERKDNSQQLYLFFSLDLKQARLHYRPQSSNDFERKLAACVCASGIYFGEAAVGVRFLTLVFDSRS